MRGAHANPLPMRIAAFQRFPIFDNAEAVADVILRDLLWADAHDVDLALFSESYLQGHSYRQHRVERRAMSLDSPAFLSILEKLAPAKATAIIGCFERRGDTVFNSAVVVEGGVLRGTYAKAYPLESGCLPGTEFPVWSRSGRTFGINICNDTNYSDAADRLVAQGADLICCPINMVLRPIKAEIWREEPLEHLRSCARRTKRWYMCCDAVGAVDYEADEWFSYGNTAIIAPDGSVIGKAVEGVEDVVMADLP